MLLVTAVSWQHLLNAAVSHHVSQPGGLSYTDCLQDVMSRVTVLVWKTLKHKVRMVMNSALYIVLWEYELFPQLNNHILIFLCWSSVTFLKWKNKMKKKLFYHSALFAFTCLQFTVSEIWIALWLINHHISMHYVILLSPLLGKCSTSHFITTAITEIPGMNKTSTSDNFLWSLIAQNIPWGWFTLF